MFIRQGKIPSRGESFRTTCPGCGGYARSGGGHISGGYDECGNFKTHSQFYESWKCSRCNGKGIVLVKEI